HLIHSHAHDALSDVYATIAIAKLVKTAQPKLFEYLFQLRNKHKVAALIDIVNLIPLVHVSGMLGAYRGNISWVVPLEWHPGQPNAVIVCDLAGDVTPLLTLPATELRQQLYTKRLELDEQQSPIPLKLIHTNKCPVIAPAKTLTEQNAQRLNIDREHCLSNLALFRQYHQLIHQKVVDIIADSTFPTVSKDVEQQLYDGFFSKHDQRLMELILIPPANELSTLSLPFADSRLTELLFRDRARN